MTKRVRTHIILENLFALHKSTVQTEQACGCGYETVSGPEGRLREPGRVAAADEYCICGTVVTESCSIGVFLYPEGRNAPLQ